MSFGFGIGDLILACQGVVAVYSRCKNAPLEIVNVADEVQRMETTLGLLGRAVVDEKSFVQKHGEKLVAMITDDIPPMEQDIRKIKRLIKQWNSIPRTQAPLLARAKFIAWDLTSVKELRSSLEGYRRRIIEVLPLITLSEQDAQSAQAQAEKKRRILESRIENNARKLRDAKEELHRIQMQATQERIYKALENLDKKVPDSVSRIARNKNAVSLAALEKTLVDSGIPAEEVKVHLDYFMAVMEKDTATQPAPNVPQINVQGVSDNPSPGSSGINRHRSDAGSKSKGISRSPQSNKPRPLSSSNSPVIGPSSGDLAVPISLNTNKAGSNVPTQFPVRNAPIWNTAGKKILCVDGSNGVRSIIATTYLEIMRVWTANSTNRWLFKRVSSAGLNVSSEYIKANLSTLNLQDDSKLLAAGSRPDPKITSSLFAPPNYAWANGFPEEKTSIARRIQSNPSKGILEHDFDLYDYVLTFNAAVGEKILTKLLDVHNVRLKSKGKPPSRTKIHLLQGCDLFYGSECLNDPTKMDKMTTAIKAAIKEFLKAEFAWEIDVCMQWPKRLRTLQILMKLSEMKHFMTKNPKWGNWVEDRTKISKWNETTGCNFWVAFERSAENQEVWLVSIVGEKGKLAQAEALVRGTQA